MYAPYPENMMESIKKVEATRAQRMATEPRRLTAEEKDALLEKFHPDYNPDAFAEIKVGPNKGQKAPLELAEMLHSESRLLNEKIDLNKIDYDVDVLVIGGGGAGSSCAIEAHNAGADVMIVTKLRIGDANTMMAEGGIQAADKENDSPVQHYLDCFGGGHFAAKPELVKRLVMEAPDAIKWLNDLGVEFDKAEDGTMITTHGGGTSRKRMHAAKDYSGSEIMRTIRDEVLNLKIPVVEFTSAVELLKDEKGQVAGAVLLNMETGDYSVARAKTVVIATGGAGRMHYQGFPTSNHYGATADGLVLGYRAGASLLYQDSIQYHPTGAIYPSQIMGALVTEKVRSVGAQLVNANGEAYIHPLETRDVNASGVIRECEEGRGVEVPGGLKGVWLDTSMIEILTARLQEESISCFVLQGSTKKERRAQMVEQFNRDDTSVFCISLKAGGTGLNLTGADIVIHYDPWWNVAVENQATDRAHRIGQKNVVTVYKLIAKGTIEEKIIKLQQMKEELAEEILSGDEIKTASFQREELLELLEERF